MDKKLVVLITLTGTFIAAVCVKSDFIRFLLGFEVLVLLAAWGELFIYRGKIRMILNLPRTVYYRGEQFPVHIRGTNDALIPVPEMQVTILIRDRWADREMLASGNLMLDAKESGRLILSFDPGYCGVYEIELRSIYLKDHLGIFKRRVPSTEHTKTLYVLPETANTNAMDTVLGDEESEGDQSIFKKGRSAVDTADIREYRSGDLMHHIHWKLSAKEMKLMVREMGQPLEKMNRIYLNLQYTDQLSRDTWEEFLYTVAKMSLMMLNGQRYHYVYWIDTVVRKLVEYKVTDPAGLQDMMCGLLFAKPWRQGEVTEVLEEIRWDDTMEENIEINLQGEIVSSKG